MICRNYSEQAPVAECVLLTLIEKVCIGVESGLKEIVDGANNE